MESVEYSSVRSGTSAGWGLQPGLASAAALLPTARPSQEDNQFYGLRIKASNATITDTCHTVSHSEHTLWVWL